MTDPRHTRAWKVLRDRVVGEEPVCQLRLEGCTHWSTTGDHKLTVKARPDLALVRSNVQGACASCNWRRGELGLEELRRPAKKAPALDLFD